MKTRVKAATLITTMVVLSSVAVANTNDPTPREKENLFQFLKGSRRRP